MALKRYICKLTKKEANLKMCVGCDDLNKIGCRVMENLLGRYKWGKIKKSPRKVEG